ncbi:hypothetical protein ACNKHT_00780 [Shigella flexneri]
MGDKVSTGSLIMVFEVAGEQARQLRRLDRKRLRQRPLHQQLA